MEAARSSYGLFLFYAHPVTLATENKGRQSTTTMASVHGEAWGVEALAWKSGGEVPAWALLAAGWLLLGPLLDRMGAEGSLDASRMV